jgi:thiamine-monophosphate kinase
MEKVSDIGEEGLLARIRDRIGPAGTGEIWSGDDAAVVNVRRERMLFATDLMVESVDFELSYSTGADIGWKAIAINVSDLAAMGGFPLHAVASVSLRPETEVAFFDSLLEGLLDAGAEWRVSLVGGDISSATEIMVSVAMVGTSDDDPVLRSGARVGDAICVTGTLGASAGGLFALRNELRGGHHAIDGMIRRHLRPRARVLEGLRIARLGATSMIDVSDGLALDLKRLMTASGTGCRVEPATVPIEPALGEMLLLVAGSPEPLDLALRGGEDYELLFTIDGERYPEAKMLLGELGTQVTAIGEVTDGSITLGDQTLEGGRLGWDHLRRP